MAGRCTALPEQHSPHIESDVPESILQLRSFSAPTVYSHHCRESILTANETQGQKSTRTEERSELHEGI